MTSNVVLIAGDNAKQIGSIGQIESLSIAGSLTIGNVGSLVGCVINVSSTSLAAAPRSTPVLLLPRAFPLLLGRQAEVQKALEALPYDLSVDIYGTAGVGKTAFLRYLAYHPVIARFSDGIIYHPLVRHQSVSDLLQVLFNAFYECPIPFKGTDIQIREALKGKKALLLFDGATLAREAVDGLINALPSCTFLFASPERQLWGEGRVIELRGLALNDAVALVTQELGRSLSPAERSEAEALCAALEGHPLRILQSVALVREDKKSLAAITQRYQATAPAPASLTQQILEQLPNPQRVVLFLLAALGANIALGAERIADIAQLSDVKSAIESLQRRQLLQVEGDRYRLATNLTAPIRQQADLTGWTQRLTTYFTQWIQQNQANPDQLSKEGDAIFQVLAWAVQAGQWSNVLWLGKAIEGGLALSGQWDSWNTVLQWMLQGAQVTGDRSMEAFALHQLGTRSLCLHEMTLAHDCLRQALEIRESLNDQAGIEATRHNLNFILEPSPPSQPTTELPIESPLPPGRFPRSSWLWKGSLAAFLVVTVGLLVSHYAPSSTYPQASPTPSSTHPQASPTSSSSPTATPSPTMDSSSITATLDEPNPSKIKPSESSRLCYKVANASSATLENYGSLDLNKACVDVSPKTTTTYAIMAIGRNGEKQTSNTVQITVLSPPLPITARLDEPNPSEIKPGEASRLCYKVTNASSATLKNYGSLDLNQSCVDVSPKTTTTYSITVIGSNGQQQPSNQVKVTVLSQPAPKTIIITARGGVNLRNAPGGAMIGGLPYGSAVSLTGNQVVAGGRSWVQLTNGGWIPEDSVGYR